MALAAPQKKLVEGDLTILQSRLQCLEKIFESSSSLSSYLALWNEPSTVSGAAGASSRGDSAKLLGKSPPARTFMKLRVLAEWEDEIDNVLECDSVDAIEQLKTRLSEVFKQPVADLIAACKSASGDLSKSLKAVAKATEQQQSVKPRSAKKSTGAATGGLNGRLPPDGEDVECCSSQGG